MCFDTSIIRIILCITLTSILSVWYEYSSIDIMFKPNYRKTTFTPIMFMSARSEESDQVRAMMSGGDDYITKPFSYDLLL
ncbi:hypothetical protein DOS61_10185, partial [Staphylococcus felis]